MQIDYNFREFWFQSRIKKLWWDNFYRRWLKCSKSRSAIRNFLRCVIFHLLLFSFSVSWTRISIVYPFSDSFVFCDVDRANNSTPSRLEAQFNLKMSRDYFFPRFHVQVFASSTDLLSVDVVDSFFVIDLPSFSRLNELKISFWQRRDATETAFFL